MPTYSYACTTCGHRFDVQQSFSDTALTACPECDGRLRKLFGNVGVVFKGSGFYRTDARAERSTSSRRSAGSSTGTSAGTPAAEPVTAGAAPAASSAPGAPAAAASSGSSSTAGSSSSTTASTPRAAAD